jgi:hypothetical protein
LSPFSRRTKGGKFLWNDGRYLPHCTPTHSEETVIFTVTTLESQIIHNYNSLSHFMEQRSFVYFSLKAFG